MKTSILFLCLCASLLHSQTIQSLIDSAEPGSTIHLPPGVHQENLKLWKDLTLVGNDQVFLQWNPNPIPSDVYEYGPAVTIYSNANVTLRNVTIQKSRGDPVARAPLFRCMRSSRAKPSGKEMLRYLI